MLIKFQPGATVCRYLFTAKSLYVFRVSQHPSSGVLKTVTATSGTGHNTGTATSLQRGLIRPCWSISRPVLQEYSAVFIGRKQWSRLWRLNITFTCARRQVVPVAK